MQLKCETLLLLYTGLHQTVACRVTCQEVAVNVGLNKSCRNLTDDQWQSFDNCIEKLLNSNNPRGTTVNSTYHLSNIDVTIKKSTISNRDLKKFIYEYDDTLHSKIKYIWDCCIKSKEDFNLLHENSEDSNIQEYEPVAIHCYGNNVPDITYKPFKPSNVGDGDNGEDDDELIFSEYLNISPQYKPSPIKCTNNPLDNKEEDNVLTDCDKTLNNKTLTFPPPYVLACTPIRTKRKRNQTIKCTEDTEYIPSGQEISNKTVDNVPEYIPTPISWKSCKKKSTSSPNLLSEETIEHFETNVQQKQTKKITNKRNNKNIGELNITKNLDIKDVVPLRHTTRSLTSTEKQNKINVKCDKKELSIEYDNEKFTKLNAKHKELFGSDDDDDNDFGNNREDVSANNSKIKSDDKQRNIKNKRKRDPSSGSGVTNKQQFNKKTFLKLSKNMKPENKKMNYNEKRNKDDGCKKAEYMPTKEEIKNMEKENALRHQQALKWREQLEQMKSREVKVAQHLTLKDMTLEEILATFNDYKSDLDAIYVECCRQSFVKSYNGLNHCFVYYLIEDEYHIKLLQKLCDIYGIRGRIMYPSMLANAILPEWLIRIFMHKHQLNRQEAMKQIRDQEYCQLDDDVNESLFKL